MSFKTNPEVLAEIYRNTQLALTSIADILPEIKDDELKSEIMRQHEGYERIAAKAAVLATEHNCEIKEPSPIKKAMMWSGIKMNTMVDNTRAHIAEMMIQGTVMGITALKRTKSESENLLSEQILSLLNELIEAEESYERSLKAFL